jgi:MYXO-CTERM domain-containing protein
VVLGLDLSSDAYPALLDPVWGPTGSLAVPRTSHTATTLTDGRVLVVGGYDPVANRETSSAEIYDPASGTFAATSPLAVARRAHYAARLTSGEVAVLGGDVGLGVPTVLASIERYDPRTGAFAPGGTLSRERTHATATVLASGALLVTGGLSYTDGLSLADAELCTGDATTCRPTRALPEPRADHSATLLRDGRVLVAGGGGSVFSDARPRLATSTIFDPTNESWAEGPPLPEPRFGHVAVTGTDGRVFLVGGALAAQGAAIAVDVLSFSPGATRFVVAGRLLTPRWLHAATVLPTGRVLVTGTAAADYQLGASTSAELFDPRTGTSRDAGDIHRTYFNAQALLDDGRALAIGGGRGAESAKTYVLADDPPDAGGNDAGIDTGTDATPAPGDAAPSPDLDAAPIVGPVADDTGGFYACSAGPPGPPSDTGSLVPAVLAAVAALALARRRER